MVDEKRLMTKLDEINRNLVKVAALVAVSGKGQQEQARTLTKMGFTSTEVEEMTGVPAPTVRWLKAQRSQAKR